MRGAEDRTIPTIAVVNINILEIKFADLKCNGYFSSTINLII